MGIGSLCWVPPSLTLPHKGGGNGKTVTCCRMERDRSYPVRLSRFKIATLPLLAPLCSLPPCGGGLGRGVTQQRGADEIHSGAWRWL
jgi:hypothetical protein